MLSLRRNYLPLLLWSVLVCTGFFASASRADDCAECDQLQSLLVRRPCGPDSIKGPLRYLFFQGCAGADFRSACRQHDACYDRIGSCQADCDLQFLNALLVECHKSKFPAHARFRAYMSYWAVSVAGFPAWEAAQILSISKANGTYVAPIPKPAPEQFTGIFAGFAKLPPFSK
jgi:hypothetical protein